MAVIVLGSGKDLEREDVGSTKSEGYKEQRWMMRLPRVLILLSKIIRHKRFE